MFCEETERHFLQRLGKLRGRTNFMHFVLPMHLTPSRSCASAKDCSTVSNQLELTNSETMDGLHDTSGGGQDASADCFKLAVAGLGSAPQKSLARALPST